MTLFTSICRRSGLRRVLDYMTAHLEDEIGLSVQRRCSHFEKFRLCRSRSRVASRRNRRCPPSGCSDTLIPGHRHEILRCPLSFNGYFLAENLLIVGFGVLLGTLCAFAINRYLVHRYELARLPWICLPIGAVTLWLPGPCAARSGGAAGSGDAQCVITFYGCRLRVAGASLRGATMVILGAGRSEAPRR